MADISKITLPSNDEYNIKDATARQGLNGKQDVITVDGVLQGDGSGNITAAASSTAGTLNNPNSDGTYVLQNTVSSGTSTLSWGEGGGSSSIAATTSVLKGDGNGGAIAATAGTDFAAVSHTHGNITSDGDITATAPTIANGDQLIINDDSAGKITNGPTFDGSTTSQFLSKKGTWETPTDSDENVKQTAATPSSYTYWRPLLVGSSYNSTEGFTPSTVTAGTYTFNTLEVQPSSGSIRMGTASMYNGSYTSKISPTTLTANRTITIPDASGTMALTSDIPIVPSPADTTPLMDNATAAIGTSTDYAREDHVHPTDTSRQAKITASGILKGDGSGGVTAATAGTDYQSPLPSQSNNSGKFLTTNGTAMSWANVDALPSQANNNGKFLTTNGTSASWTSITEDDHKWNDVALNKTSKNGYGGFVPYVDENTSTTAGLKMATTSPTKEAVALWDGNKYLYSTTPASSDNSTKVATTAYVTTAVSGVAVPQASTTIPSMDGTASYGSGTTWARADHVHPTDTSRAASSHSHGDITNSGDITASAPTITTGDQLIINDESASKITNSGITFDTNVTTTYLRRDGTWATIPSELPDQTGNSGRYLITYGGTLYWNDLPKEIFLCTYNSTTFVEIQQAIENFHQLCLLNYLGKTYISAFVDYEDIGGETYLTCYNFINVTDNEINKITVNIDETWSGPISTTIPDDLPSQTGNSGKYLTTNGTNASWATVETLPSQTGNSGKYLTTNGTAASWGAASATSTKSIDSAPTSSSSNLVTSGGVYTAINNKVNRTTAVNAADTNYTTLMARGVKLLDATTFDAVSNWSSELVNGAIAWRYE